MKILGLFAAALMLAPGGGVLAQDRASSTVEFKPGKLRFSSVLMGRCKPKKIEAINISGAAITDPSFRVLDGVDAYSLQKRGKCPNPMEPGQTCRAYVNFCPGMFGSYKGTLAFTGSEREIPLSGSGKQGGR